MTRKLAELVSEHGQITNIRLSDASGGKTNPTAMQFGYVRHESEDYLGNTA